jgi:hypothetical protein
MSPRLTPLLFVAIAACGSSVDISPVEADIDSASQIGLTASVAMSAMSSTTSVPCAQVTQACTSFPCANGAVTITLGAECPFPIGGAGSGSVTVTGSWTSATSATLSESFTNVQVGSTASVVTSATSITATPGSVTFTGQNVNVNGAAVFAAQANFTVNSNGAGQGFTVSGSDQIVSGALSNSQVSLEDVVLSPSCTENPTGGSATLQSVNGLHIQNDTITFHSACDGKVEVNGNTQPLSFGG